MMINVVDQNLPVVFGQVFCVLMLTFYSEGDRLTFEAISTQFK